MTITERQVSAVALILQQPEEVVADMLVEFDPEHPRFRLTYQQLSALTGVRDSTLRNRVKRGYYVEGVHYRRVSPHKPLFSMAAAAMEKKKS